MIVIGIIAYRNNNDLLVTLSSLEHISIPQGQEIEIIVVDSDELKSAEEVVQQQSHDYKHPLIYINQPKKGGALLKNEPLHYAVKMFIDYVAYIESGKEADQYWLLNLYSGLKKYNADVIAGPIIKSKTSEKRCMLRNGALLNKNISTSNVLISSQIYKRWMQRFDNKFSDISGEDTDFFYRAWKKGGKHVWSNEAIIYGSEPKLPKSFKELATKHSRLGLLDAMIYIVRNKPMVGHAILLPKILEKFFISISLILIGIFYSIFSPAKARKSILKGIFKLYWIKGVMKTFFTPMHNN